MALQEALTMETAEAKFIQSLSYLVWIYLISIFVTAYLTINGYQLPAELVNGVVKILITLIWIFFLLKLIKLVDKYITTRMDN